MTGPLVDEVSVERSYHEQKSTNASNYSTNDGAGLIFLPGGLFGARG